ncbi:MAG: DUF4097 family beta strand repeat protein [Clostridia bacterium]|nr:DUF4097 family beta strand repeat protein [Clostridia bacterium]
MKLKKLIPIALILLLLGLVCGIAGIAMNGFTFQGLDNTYTRHETSISDPVTTIRVDEKNGAVRILPWDGSEISLTYYTSEHENYTITTADGTLSIEKTTERKWYMFSFSLSAPELIIRVPEGFSGDVEVVSSNGKLEADSIRAGTLSLTTSNGEVDLEDVRADLITVRTSNGSIEFDDIEAGEISLKTSNGAIEGSLPHPRSHYSITSQTSNGSNNAPSIQPGGVCLLTLITTNGSIDVEFDD